MKKRRPWEIPQTDEIVGGKYRVEQILGEGGLAVVLGAKHLQLEESVAIKMLLPKWAGNDDVVDRFLKEGRTAVRIRGEHVARVHDVGMHAGGPYIVMERLEGCDLEAFIRESGPLPTPVAVDLVLQAIEAIAEAHGIGIVHRDLKPANLFLTRRTDGSSCIKVLDFGISKVGSDTWSRTNPELTMGSPPYMPPEQLVSASAADVRADIWALGVVLYELLSGALPFQGKTTPELCVNVMHDAPKALSSLRPDMPTSLEATVMLCLEKDPADRFANVAEPALALVPFGTQSAHASAERVVRILRISSQVRAVPRPRLSPSPPPILPEPYSREDDDDVSAFAHGNRRTGAILLAALTAVSIPLGFAVVYTLGAAPPTTALASELSPPPPSLAPLPLDVATITVETTSTTTGAPALQPEPTRGKQSAGHGHAMRASGASQKAPTQPSALDAQIAAAFPSRSPGDSSVLATGAAVPSRAPPPPVARRETPSSAADPDGLFDDRR
jgi:serine/threonine protein kinase